MQASLTVRDCACRRGDRILFRGVGFQASAGAAVRIAGPNGVGKSSLMRICGGLLRPCAGRVEHTGAIGLLDERTALDPERTLAAALTFWARMDGAASRTGHAKRMGIDALLDVPVRYLSTGQRKRAAIVRLLQQSAPIWLLDEPLNGLDGDGQERLVNVIADHRAGGGLCIVASHQPLELADMRVVELPDYAP